MLKINEKNKQRYGMKKSIWQTNILQTTIFMWNWKFLCMSTRGWNWFVCVWMCTRVYIFMCVWSLCGIVMHWLGLRTGCVFFPYYDNLCGPYLQVSLSLSLSLSPSRFYSSCKKIHIFFSRPFQVERVYTVRTCARALMVPNKLEYVSHILCACDKKKGIKNVQKKFINTQTHTINTFACSHAHTLFIICNWFECVVRSWTEKSPCLNDIKLKRKKKVYDENDNDDSRKKNTFKI